MDPLMQELLGNFKQVPLLSTLDDKMLEKVAEEGRLLLAMPQQVICREGEYGESVFVNLGGMVKISRRDEQGKQQFLAWLGQNDLFGEMSVIAGQPRGATVAAESKTYLLEIERPLFLELMKKVPKFKAYVDALYRDRSLKWHLRLVPIFSGVKLETLGRLAQIAQLVSFERGKAVVKEGEPADSLFLVKSGYLKVTKKVPGGKDQVIAYLRDNNYFGEQALLGGGPRSATVTALSPTECVKVGREPYEALAKESKDLAARREAMLDERLRRMEGAQDAKKEDTSKMQILVSKGLVATREMLVIDTNKCVRCEICVRSCASTHKGNSRIHLSGFVINDLLLPTACFQCKDPECMLACRFGCISRDRQGQIFINEYLCTGCSLCSKACPYGSIIMSDPPKKQERSRIGKFIARMLGRTEMEEEQQEAAAFAGMSEDAIAKGKKAKQKAAKCDLCIGYGFTSCVYNCPTGAIDRVDPEKFFVRI